MQTKRIMKIAHTNKHTVGRKDKKKRQKVLDITQQQFGPLKK